MISAILHVPKGFNGTFLSKHECLSCGQTARKSRKKLYLALSIGASLIILSWIGVEVRLFKGELEQVMTALNIYTDTLIQRDYESAYLITSPAFREGVSYPAFVTEQKELTERLGRLKSARQTDWDIDSINDAKSANVKVNLQFEDGSVDFRFTLHKELGIWRVFSCAGLGDNLTKAASRQPNP
jgi:hypothetical protein